MSLTEQSGVFENRVPTEEKMQRFFAACRDFSPKGVVVLRQTLKQQPEKVSWRNTQGRGTGLHAAAWAANDKGVRLLVEAGAEVDAVNEKGRTALMCAVKKGSLQIVEYLLSKNANIHHEDNDGKTALMIATVRGNHAMADILMKHGANVLQINQGGVSALDIAFDSPKQRTALRAIFKQHIQNIVNEDINQALQGTTQKIKTSRLVLRPKEIPT